VPTIQSAPKPFALFAPWRLKKSYWGSLKNKNETRNFNPVPLFTLKEVSEGKAVITIAHRLSTVVGSDKIIVIDSGKVVQKRNEQKLQQEEGLFRVLFDGQRVERYVIVRGRLW
jgi:hypothetical protein